MTRVSRTHCILQCTVSLRRLSVGAKSSQREIDSVLPNLTREMMWNPGPEEVLVKV